MGKKLKKKVRLPKDSTGRPIHIGDVLEWRDGECMRVGILNYYGDDNWTAEDGDGDDFTDNLRASTIVSRRGHG